MDKQSFVVLGEMNRVLRQYERCAAIRHNSKDLLNYFIDKLRLGSVTVQIRLPLCAILRLTKIAKNEHRPIRL